MEVYIFSRYYEYGANMVEFFFLVSGFLMAASVVKKDTAGVSVWKSTWQFLFHKIKCGCLCTSRKKELPANNLTYLLAVFHKVY